MKRERGFAMLLVFVMAAAIAITLYTELPRVAFEAQRNQEAMLIERGEQYSRAIELYVRKMKKYPATMDELESTNQVRFLRKRYNDPMTGKSEWRLVHVGPGGVFTDSLVHPLPTGKDEKSVNSFTNWEGTNTINAQQPGGPPIRPSERAGMGPPQQPGQGAVIDPLNPQQQQQQQQFPGLPQGLASTQNFQTATGQTGGQMGGQPGPPGAPPLPPGVTAPPGAYPPGGYPTNPLANPQGRLNPSQQRGQLPIGMPPGYPVQQQQQQQQAGASPGGLWSYSTQPGAQGAPQAGQQGTPAGLQSMLQPGATPTPSGQPGATPLQPGQPNQALNMINQILQNPRGQAPAAAGLSNTTQPNTTQLGAGIAGIASTVERTGIKVYNEMLKYNEWEFLYDANAGLRALQQGQQGQQGQQPGQNRPPGQPGDPQPPPQQNPRNP